MKIFFKKIYLVKKIRSADGTRTRDRRWMLAEWQATQQTPNALTPAIDVTFVSYFDSLLSFVHSERTKEGIGRRESKFDERNVDGGDLARSAFAALPATLPASTDGRLFESRRRNEFF